MSVDVKDMREEAAEAVEPATNATEGEPVNRRVERRVQEAADDAAEAIADVVSGNLAERLALNGIRVISNRSRKQDLIGNVLHRGLGIFNTVLDGTAKELGKFQAASRPPARSGGRRNTAAARRSTSRRARSTVGRTRRRARQAT